jgi:FkbH-like protein
MASTGTDGALIKCVVWDIDNTLLDGVYLESGEQPPPANPVLLGVVRELAGRGILQAVASKNPPAAAGYVAQLADLDFAATECGWDAKPDALGRIAAGLGLIDAEMAFVDDDMLERAEVAAVRPGVLVLTPADAAEAASWPQFSPPVVTAPGQTSCGTSALGSPSRRQPPLTCPGCMSFRCGPTSSARAASRSPRRSWAACSPRPGTS